VTGEVEYGVRGPDPRNTVQRMPSRDDAVDALLPGDVVVIRTRAEYEQWSEWKEVDR
jgi:hypothetical protein